MTAYTVLTGKNFTTQSNCPFSPMNQYSAKEIETTGGPEGVFDPVQRPDKSLVNLKINRFL